MGSTPLARRTAVGLVAVITMFAAACGDDAGDDGQSEGATTSAPTTTAEAEIALSPEFCAAFGDPAWVAFSADPRTEADAAQIEVLVVDLEASAPEALAEEVEAMNTASTELVAVWRDANFDPAAVDTGALTDLSVAAADSVHRIEGLAEESCGITRGDGGPFATG
ncbi:MAG: hypothetical protein AAGK32_09775 [Actinomycetota bacterium]